MILAHGATAQSPESSGIPGIQTIEDLDKAAVFSFAIMGDSHNNSPKTAPEFARMVKWIKEAGDAFVIGLGDHVVKGLGRSFLDFLAENKWWHDQFYPNVADNENQFYGKGQDDWGAGKKIFDEVNLRSRKHVEIRPNGAEYYAKIPVKGYTVHLIQLSYPDEPPDPVIAFPPDSRQFLADTIRKINKGDKDIIIACAHSRYGWWTYLLSDEQRKVVMEKADLVLSATVHVYARIPVQGYKNRGALCVNTGSITNPRFFTPPGYVQVHVLGNPLRLVVQYIHANREKRELQSGEYAWLKYVNGKIEPARFPGVPYPPEADLE
jgi:predicted phosphodiesterase